MIPALLVLWLAATTPLEQAERAVLEGQSAIQQEKYAEAARLLQEGVEAAAAIDDPAIRTQALAATHFFSGLAYSALGEQARTREEIEQFLIYSPSTTSVDKSQYPQRFVSAFAEVSRAVRAIGSSEFDRRYPGFRIYSTEMPAQSSAWQDSPAARYLATGAELTEWKTLTGDAARTRFIEEFWKRRDPTPATEENEFRATFNGRIAFADRAFEASEVDRGSLTDRGRVFVLLGKPREVMYERISASSDAEIWGYDREQLPVRIRDRSFLFRFVDDLNQDFVLPFNSEAERVLTAAASKAGEPRK